MQGQVLHGVHSRGKKQGMKTRSGFQLAVGQASRVRRRPTNVASGKTTKEEANLQDSSPACRVRGSPTNVEAKTKDGAKSSPPRPQVRRSPRSKASNMQESSPPSLEAFSSSRVQMPSTPRKVNASKSYCSLYDQFIIDGLCRRLSMQHDTKGDDECLNAMEDGHMEDGMPSSSDNHDPVHTSSSEYLGVESEESKSDGEIAEMKGKMKAKKRERKATRKEVATSKDDAINAESSEKEAKSFFEVVNLDDGSGRVARQCRADALCPMRGYNFFKRARLQEHLKVHGEYRTVPFLQMGRPTKGNERQRSGDVEQFVKQQKKRFYEKDRKMAFAKETHEDRQYVKAEYMWDHVFTDVHKAPFASKEAYIMQFVQVQMAAYDAKYALREQETSARISRGYEKQRRKPKSDVKLEEAQHVDVDGSVEAPKIDPDVATTSSPPKPKAPKIDSDHKAEEATISPPPKQEDAPRRSSRLKLPIKSAALKRGSGEAPKIDSGVVEEATISPPLERPRRSSRLKFPTNSATPKSGSTKESSIPVPSPDAISRNATTIIKSYQRGFVEVLIRRGSPTKARWLDGQRPDLERRIEFRSLISRLVARVDMPILNGIANNGQACTDVMNLFAMWMENIAEVMLVGRTYCLDAIWFRLVENQKDDKKVESLFSHIDASDLTWIFFPISKSNHWCLFAWFNPAYKKLSKLDTEKTTLIYMDSLRGIIDPFQCIPSIHSALRALSKSCSNPMLSAQLAMPLVEVEYAVPPVPQQTNTHDCGYFVMAFCIHLSRAGSLKRLDPNKWLTKDWFSCEDVYKLRKDLHEWIQNILDEA